MSKLSTQVTVSEVGPRDGLQILKNFVPTQIKARLIEQLAGCGLTRIEVSGFAHPKVIPQLADAEELVPLLKRRQGVRLAAFVPNVRGADRALRLGLDDLKVGASASDTFNRINIRMSTGDALSVVGDIANAARGSQSAVVGVVGTAFGCPYEGQFGIEPALRVVESYVLHGIRLIYLADTTGMANPGLVRQAAQALHKNWPGIEFGLHLHNTRGLGIANALAGLDEGVRHFEASVGGLGGCPFAPRAVGNICTEDFVHMLHEMGYSTGIDLDRLIQASKEAEQLLNLPLPGMVMKAGTAAQRHSATSSGAAG